MRYIYTDSASPDELQRYIDDGDSIGATLYAGGGYTIEQLNGKPQIIGKKNGVDSQGARTTGFDVVKPKYGAVGFYCRSFQDHYAGKLWIDQLPVHTDYVGLNETDDISAWIEPNGDFG